MPPERRTRRAENLALGRRGEEIAAAWLVARGFTILGRNLRVGRSELDLVALDHGTLVAIEVKTRSDHLAPERLVHDATLARFEAALATLQPSLAPRARSLRVDVVAVRWEVPGAGPEVRHFVGSVRCCGT